ncbi:MAG: hypothetical protein M3125_07770 [Gemmatimonadota bacterium]|nr:hypothetical protein [Gemmatimonadota bacterium]
MCADPERELEALFKTYVVKR